MKLEITKDERWLLAAGLGALTTDGGAEYLEQLLFASNKFLHRAEIDWEKIESQLEVLVEKLGESV